MIKAKRKFLKWGLGALSVLIMVPVLVLLVAPQFWKGKLVDALKNEINRNTKAQIDFDDQISLSFFKSFPNLNMDVGDFLVKSPGFSSDTLFFARKLSLKIDLRSVWKGEVVAVHAVSLKEALLHIEVDSAGYTNYDVLLDSEDSSTAPVMRFDLRNITLSNSRVRYIDHESDIFMNINGVDALANADFTLDSFDLHADIAANELSYAYNGVSYLNCARFQGKANLFTDLIHWNFWFKDNSFSLNDLPLSLKGRIGLPENGDIVMDMNIDCPGATVQHLLSFVPELYEPYLKGLKASGNAIIGASLFGVYNEGSFPAYTLNVNLDQGRLQYENMPLPLEQITLKMMLHNSDSLASSALLAINPLNFTLQGNPVSMKLDLADLFGDPFVSGELNGKVNLEDFAQFFPFEKGTVLKGKLDGNMSLDGRISALSAGKIGPDNQANAKIQLTNLFYQNADLAAPVKASNAHFKLRPDLLAELSGDLTIAGSDIRIDGILKNVLALLSPGSVIDAEFNLKSNKINADELLSLIKKPDASAQSAENSAPELPKGLNLNIKSQINELIYNKIKFSNLIADARVFDGALLLRNASLNSFGGKLAVNGTYQPDQKGHMLSDLNLDLSLLNIPEFLSSFDLTRRLTPFYKQIEGKMNARLHFSSLLDQSLMPDLSTLNIQGLVNGSGIRMDQISGLKLLGEKLQIQELDHIETKAIQIAMELLNGRLNIKPFSLEHKDIRLEWEGFTTLDQQIEYKGKLFIPASLIQGKEKIWNDLVSKSRFKSVHISPDDVLEVNAILSGAILKPNLQLSLKDVKKGIRAAIEKEVRAELDAHKKAAEDRARAEMEAAKKQAEEKAREIEDRAKRELEEQKKAAEEKLRLEADRRKRELEDAARRKLKDVLKPPL